VIPGFGVAPPQTPGPGTYQAPSEFGIYKASEKFIKEAEIAEKLKTSRSHHKKSESALSARSQTISRSGKMALIGSVAEISKKLEKEQTVEPKKEPLKETPKAVPAEVKKE